MTSEMTGEERRFVEDLAVFFEDWGASRMAGRVFAALLMADPPEVSSAHLAESLDVSSGSISTTTRELIRLGLVERVGVPGERRDYFRANTAGLSQLPRDQLAFMGRMHALMERGEDIAKDRDPSVRHRLGELHAFYEFLENEMTAVLDRWEAGRPGRPTG